MTSEKKIAANRINAMKSRGPRTAAAKSRVSRNALRHGLAALKHLDAMLTRDIALMADAICAGDTNPLLFEQALLIAESEMVLRCVRAQRIAVVERLRYIKAMPLADLALKPTPIEKRDEVDAMREAMPDLHRLARYERTAWSRRKRALRNFTEIKSRSDDEGMVFDNDSL
jgi:hypothetical protein